nr:MAG: hypothetical protein BRC64_01670 [Halobacteriales archaeon QH_10_67_22]
MPTDAPSNGELYAHMDAILSGHTVSNEDVVEIFEFTREYQSIPTPQDTWFVLGSYQSPYRYRLRGLADRLNRHLFTYAFLMADHADATETGWAETHVKFHLLARYVDHIAMVMEHTTGGQVGELNDLTYDLYFEKSHVLPRLYRDDLTPHFEDESDVVEGARLLLNAGFSSDAAEGKLEELVSDEQRRKLDGELSEVVAEAKRQNRSADYDIGSYSQVQHGKYDLFEDRGRLLPWMTVPNFYAAVGDLPVSDDPPS